MPAAGHAYSTGCTAGHEYWTVANKDFSATGSHGSSTRHGSASSYDVCRVITSEPSAATFISHEPHDDAESCSRASGTESVQPQRYAQSQHHRCLLPSAILTQLGQHALPLLCAHALSRSHVIGVLGPLYQFSTPEALSCVGFFSSCTALFSHLHAFPGQPRELSLYPCWHGSPCQQPSTVPCVLGPSPQPLQDGHVDGFGAGTRWARQPGASRSGI